MGCHLPAHSQVKGLQVVCRHTRFCWECLKSEQKASLRFVRWLDRKRESKIGQQKEDQGKQHGGAGAWNLLNSLHQALTHICEMGMTELFQESVNTHNILECIVTIMGKVMLSVLQGCLRLGLEDVKPLSFLCCGNCYLHSWGQHADERGAARRRRLHICFLLCLGTLLPLSSGNHSPGAPCSLLSSALWQAGLVHEGGGGGKEAEGSQAESESWEEAVLCRNLAALPFGFPSLSEACSPGSFISPLQASFALSTSTAPGFSLPLCLHNCVSWLLLWLPHPITIFYLAICF